MRIPKNLLLIFALVLFMSMIILLSTIDTGLDVFNPPEKMDMVTRSYCRLQTEKTTYAISQDIPITCSTGFLSTFQLAEKTEAEAILIELVADDYVILKSDINCEIPIEDIDLPSLVLTRKGIFARITKDSLGFTFPVQLSVKDTAPKICNGVVTVKIRLVTYGEDPVTGQTVALDVEPEAYASFRYKIENGSIKLYE